MLIYKKPVYDVGLCHIGSGDDINIGVIIGAVIAASIVVSVIIILMITVLCLRRNRQTKRKYGTRHEYAERPSAVRLLIIL